MIQPTTLIEREATGGTRKIQHLLLLRRFGVTVFPADVVKWKMDLMKLEVVVEVFAEMMMLNLKIILLLLEIKGAVIGLGNAACVFTLSTNHYNTIQAI